MRDDGRGVHEEPPERGPSGMHNLLAEGGVPGQFHRRSWHRPRDRSPHARPRGPGYIGGLSQDPQGLQTHTQALPVNGVVLDKGKLPIVIPFNP